MTSVALLVLTACSKDATKIAPDQVPNVNGPDGGPSDPNHPGPSTPGADTNISGSRLLRRVYKGADGSQQFVGWFDSQTMRTCDFHPAADGKLRCLPTSSSAGGLGLFNDTDCKSPVAFVSPGCAIEPTSIAALTSGSFCGATTTMRILQTGPKIIGGSVFRFDVTGACTAIPTSSYLASYDLYATGAELPPTNFVEAAEDHI